MATAAATAASGLATTTPCGPLGAKVRVSRSACRRTQGRCTETPILGCGMCGRESRGRPHGHGVKTSSRNGPRDDGHNEVAFTSAALSATAGHLLVVLKLLAATTTARRKSSRDLCSVLESRLAAVSASRRITIRITQTSGRSSLEAVTTTAHVEALHQSGLLTCRLHALLLQHATESLGLQSCLATTGAATATSEVFKHLSLD